MGLEGRLKIPGIKKVVLNGVARARDAPFQSREWCAGTPAGAHGRPSKCRCVKLVGAEPLGFHKDLVRVLVFEAHHLVFHGGAVARPHPSMPPYMWDRSSPLRIKAWVASLVRVIQQGI